MPYFLFFSFSLFLLFSLSYFLFYLVFNHLLRLPYHLSNNLEEHLHIDIMSKERIKQLLSQILDLITNYCHLLGDSLIYFFHLYFNLIPYLMFQCLLILNLLFDLDVNFLLRFIQFLCLLFLRSFKLLFDFQVFALEILVKFDNWRNK